MSEIGGGAAFPAAAVEIVLDVLAGFGADAILIGAVALAVYRYPRSTVDVDLAVGTDPRQLDEIARVLGDRGLLAEVSHPDGADPLGGVIRVQGQGADLVEVVNFLNPPSGGFPALIEKALRDAVPFDDSARLRVATLMDLVMFKLYAGGPKSMNDVLELLRRNPDVDLAALRALATTYRLDKTLDRWLRSTLPDGTH